VWYRRLKCSRKDLSAHSCEKSIGEKRGKRIHHLHNREKKTEDKEETGLSDLFKKKKEVAECGHGRNAKERKGGDFAQRRRAGVCSTRDGTARL